MLRSAKAGDSKSAWKVFDAIGFFNELCLDVSKFRLDTKALPSLFILFVLPF